MARDQQVISTVHGSPTRSSRNPKKRPRPRGAPGGAASHRTPATILDRGWRPPSSAHIDLCHPSANAVRVELVVPGAIERIGDVNAAPVAAQLHHLRAAVQSGIRPARMRRRRTMPPSFTEPVSSGLKRIGHVVLPQFAGTPAGDVQKAIVEREVDVGDQRRHCLEPLEQRSAASRDRPARLGSRSPCAPAIHGCRSCPPGARARPTPTDPSTKSPRRQSRRSSVGSCAGRSSSTICCSAPRSSTCRWRRLCRSHTCSAWPYLPASSSSGLSAVLDHVRRAPLAGDHGVVSPDATRNRRPGTAVRDRSSQRPLSSKVSGSMHEDAARPVALR